MEMTVVTLDIPSKALKWFEKVSVIHGSKDVKEFLVEMLMRELSNWLSDEDHQVLEEITMVELWEDGIVQLLTWYGESLSWMNRFLVEYHRKHEERFKTSHAEPSEKATDS